MIASSSRSGRVARCEVNGFRRSSSTQLAPITPPKASAAWALPSGPDERGVALDRPDGGVDTVDVADLCERAGVDPLADVLGEVTLDRGGPADDHVDTVVGVFEDATEGLAHGVGQDLGAGEEADAEHDGQAGEGEAQLVRPQLLAGETEHRGYLPNVFMRSRIASAVGCSISSTMRPSARKTSRSAWLAAYGVVGDHHDGLTELTHGPLHELEDLGTGAAVEVAGRLISEDDLRPSGQRPAHRDSLLLAARELARAMLEPVPQADGVDDLVEPGSVRACAGRGPSGG